MTTYAEAVARISSQKHLLCEVEPAEELWNWTKQGGRTNIYYIDWSHLAATDVIKGGLYRLIIGVEEDGVALTEYQTLATLDSNPGGWGYSYSAGRIYVHTTGSADPDTVDMMAVIFRLHFSTTGKVYNTIPGGCDARGFDGSADYYSRASDLDGNADGKVGLLSAWVNLNGGDATTMCLLANTTSRFIFQRSSADHFQVLGRNTSGTNVLGIRTTGVSYVASSTWYHVLASWDLVSGDTHIYVNDVSNILETTADDDEIEYTRSSWAIASDTAGANKANVSIAELYFAEEYLDLSVGSNRRKFILDDGTPASLGPNGEHPTGTRPIIYASDGDGSNNLGTGGDFVANGTPYYVLGPTPRADVYYEKRILVDARADISDKASDLLIGRQRTASGTIALDNSDGLFDKLSAEWNWKNKAVRVRFGLDDIALSEYVTARELVVNDIAPTETALTLDLVEKADIWRRRFPITPHFGSGLGEGVTGTRVPVLYGEKTDIIPDLVDDEYTTPNEWVYRIADHTKQELYSVDTVYAINRSDGSRTALTLTTHYTVDLANCAITVNDVFDSGAEIEEVYEIRCDAKGVTVAELSAWGTAPTSTDYLKWPGEIAKHMLLTYLNYAEADLDLTSFTDANTDAPFELGLWIKGETTVREVLRGLERSCMSYVRPKRDGTIEFYVWDPWTGSADAIAMTDEDFALFEPDVKMTTVYYETHVRYDENPANPGSFEVETVTEDSVDYLVENAQELTVDTYLRDSSDAQLLAQRINFLYRGINIEYDFVELGTRLMNHGLNQRMRVTKTRAPTTSGALTSRLMEVLELDKDFIAPQVSGRLGDLKGLSEVIGKWTAADAPVWGDATDEEKADSGFWCDAGGLADAADPNSKNVSLWW
jgi:hypothetical protein